ncbi:MAG: CPBP family intramembrane metalloprotease [Anaerolineales bacterium]|nr:CPBP family intramembrane metalloprotease [Anaerolineales bacterium]
MKVKEWLLSVPGVFIAAAALTLIVLAESMFPAWSPYFMVYAALAIILPLVLGTYPFGSFAEVIRKHWRLTLGVFLAAVIVDQGLAGWAYQRILDSFGVGANPFYSLEAALKTLADGAAFKFGISPEAAMALYAVFLLLWAPVGEELFYRGYMQGALRSPLGFGGSALASAAFFGIRHATHFFFLYPRIPWGAAAAWVVSAFVFGLFMSFLCEKTRSLFPPILVHAGVNLVGFLLLL